MWNDIQLHPKQVSTAVRRRCSYIIGLIENYDGAVFQEMEDARHVHGSLKVENNKLSFVQTTMVLKGEIPRGETAKNQDILETLALSNALTEVRSMVGRVPFSEAVVKCVHKTCANGHLNPIYCGEYRTVMNYIGDGSFTTAAPNQINKLMHRLFVALAGESCPIVKAAFFSFNYLSIHPFMDFNGRTSRLFECYLLGEGSLPFISLKESQIEEYMNLLGEGQRNGKPYFEPYVKFILKRVEERFDEIMEGVTLNNLTG